REMLQSRSVVVVVPAFQEEAHIGSVIDTMPHFVDRVIVVDDGSRDRTSEEVRMRGGARTLLLHHPVRRGVGAAIATGDRGALALGLSTQTGALDAVAVMAGDGQMHPDDLASVVLPIIRGTADYVKGDRFHDPRVRSIMGWPRWTGGQVFSRLTSLAIGVPIT